MNRRPVSSRARGIRINSRKVLAVATLAVIATFALRDSAAQLAAKADAALAHKLAPWDGRITAQLASETLQSLGGAHSKRTALDLAHLALRDDATAVEAINVLAATAQLRGDTERTRSLFLYSLSLSRRELASRLWAIEEAVSRGDIRGALTNYDFALKTSRSAPTILYPILSSAISEPRVRAELLAILRGKPVWGAEFVNFLSAASINPQGNAAFYPELKRAGVPISRLQDARVVDGLSSRGLHDQAWRYYLGIHPGADRRKSRDPDFRLSPDEQTVLDWQPRNEGGLFASLVRSKDGGGALTYSVGATSSGKLAEQRQLLPPGRYFLRGMAQSVALPLRERPYFAVVCENGRELLQAPLPGEGETRISATFSVPSDCASQFLMLVARQIDSLSGLEGTVETAEIVPAG